MRSDPGILVEMARSVLALYLGSVFAASPERPDGEMRRSNVVDGVRQRRYANRNGASARAGSAPSDGYAERPET
jgi:hypothetical protein